jgi:hypothetical protein
VRANSFASFWRKDLGVVKIPLSKSPAAWHSCLLATSPGFHCTVVYGRNLKELEKKAVDELEYEREGRCRQEEGR